ncbi:hypothetical protein KUCAC02_011092, partial [Chaenocephalus aceratus]
ALAAMRAAAATYSHSSEMGQGSERSVPRVLPNPLLISFVCSSVRERSVRDPGMQGFKSRDRLGHPGPYQATAGQTGQGGGGEPMFGCSFFIGGQGEMVGWCFGDGLGSYTKDKSNRALLQPYSRRTNENKKNRENDGGWGGLVKGQRAGESIGQRRKKVRERKERDGQTE